MRSSLYTASEFLKPSSTIDNDKKKRGAMSPRALNQIAALPFLLPTRLADGLELEVFYVSSSRFQAAHDSPPVSLSRNIGSPALPAPPALATSADKIFNERDVTLT
jgi:hypothetical protein